MALDGITLSMLKNEISEKLIGARVDKIHQPSKAYHTNILELNNNQIFSKTQPVLQ